MHLGPYICSLAILCFLAFFLLFAMWMYTFSLTNDNKLWSIAWATLITFAVLGGFISIGLWVYRRRVALRHWLEIAVLPPPHRGLSPEDKERFLLYFDWAEDITLCRSWRGRSTKFFEEGTSYEFDEERSDFPKSQQPCKSILNGVERISPRTLQNENPAHCYTDSTSTAGLSIGNRLHAGPDDAFRPGEYGKPELRQGFTDKLELGCGVNSTCCICLNGYTRSQKVCLLPCQHMYHAECIDAWLLEHNTCPYCQSIVGDEASLPVGGQVDDRPMENLPRVSCCRLFCLVMTANATQPVEVPNFRRAVMLRSEESTGNTTPPL